MQSKRPVTLFVIGVVTGLCLGLWFGVNIGKNKSMLSNPFAERSLKKTIIESSGTVLEKSGKALKEQAR